MYIIKNCDAIHKHPVGHCNCVNGIECQKREDCLLKRLAKECKETLNTMGSQSSKNAYAGGRCVEAEKILQMLDIEVINPKIKRPECPYGGIDCAWCGEDCE